MSKLPILALDIGFKRTGAAISESGLAITPLEVLQWEAHPDQLVRQVVALVKQYEAQTVVIGVPLNSDESLTPQATKTLGIIEKIALSLPSNVEVVKQNEFSSSQEGLEKYRDKDRDTAAAMIILEKFLEEI